MGEGVFPVGEGHGVEEFFLKFLLDGQFCIVHFSGNVICLSSFPPWFKSAGFAPTSPDVMVRTVSR